MKKVILSLFLAGFSTFLFAIQVDKIEQIQKNKNLTMEQKNNVYEIYDVMVDFEKTAQDINLFKNAKIQNLAMIDEYRKIFQNLQHAIELDDYETIKKTLDNLPFILNAYYEDGDMLISFLGLILTDKLKSKNKIKLIEFLSENYKLDLNQICIILKGENSYYYYALDTIFLSKNSDKKLFEYFTKKHSKVNNALFFITLYKQNQIFQILNEDDYFLQNDKFNDFLKNGQYKKIRENFKDYYNAILENYDINGLDNIFGIIGMIRDFIITDDIEFIYFMVNTGLKNSSFYHYFISDEIKNMKMSEQMRKLLQGE